MNASELITKLENLVHQHGDLPVVAGDVTDGESIEYVEYTSDDALGKVIVVE
jgi:hypothetical protein